MRGHRWPRNWYFPPDHKRSQQPACGTTALYWAVCVCTPSYLSAQYVKTDVHVAFRQDFAKLRVQVLNLL